MTKFYNPTYSANPLSLNTVSQWHSFPSYLWFLKDNGYCSATKACVQSTLSLYFKHLSVAPNTFFNSLPSKHSSRKVSTHRWAATNTSALNGVALYKKPQLSSSLVSAPTKRYALHPGSIWNYNYLERLNVIRLRGHSPKSRLNSKFTRFTQEYVASPNLRSELSATMSSSRTQPLKLLTTYISTKLLQVRVSKPLTSPLVRQRKRFIRRDRSTRPLPYLFLGYRRNFKFFSRPPVIKGLQSVQRSWLRKSRSLVGTNAPYTATRPHLFQLRTHTQQIRTNKPNYVLRHARWFSRKLGLKPLRRISKVSTRESITPMNSTFTIRPASLLFKLNKSLNSTWNCNTDETIRGSISTDDTYAHLKNSLTRYSRLPVTQSADRVRSFIPNLRPSIKLNLYRSTTSRRSRFVISYSRSLKQGNLTSFIPRRRRRSILRSSSRSLTRTYLSNWWRIVSAPTVSYQQYTPLSRRSKSFKRNLSKKLRRLSNNRAPTMRPTVAFYASNLYTRPSYLNNRSQSVVRKVGLLRSKLNHHLTTLHSTRLVSRGALTLSTVAVDLVIRTPFVSSSPLTNLTPLLTKFALKCAPKVWIAPTHSHSFRRSPFFFTIPLLARATDSFPTPRRQLKSSIKYLVFPDANAFKTAVFRRLNRQKLLSHSRTRVLNSLTTLRKFDKVNFNERFFKPFANRAKLHWHFLSVSELTDNVEISNTFRQYPSIYVPRSRIRRIRFKPGYGRIWRAARESIREILNMPHRYQYRLTPKLQLRYFHFRKLANPLSTLKLDFALMSCHLAPDIWYASSLLDNYSVFLNGHGATNLDTRLFTGDFIQLTVSLKFYIASRWLKNWSVLKRQRVNKLFYRKFRPSGTNRRIRFVRTLPNWFFGIKFTYCDIPKYFEVDFFTLSIFLLHERTELESLLPKEPYKLDTVILNMYNWKYLT